MGIIHRIANIFGGDTYYKDGEVIGRSVENIFGGRTIYSEDGEVVARTVENMTGGETIYTYDDEEEFRPIPKHNGITEEGIDFSRFFEIGNVMDEADKYR